MQFIQRSSLVLGMAFVLSACSLNNQAGAPNPVNGGSSFSAAAGLAVYTQNCASCHGSHSSSNIRDKSYDQVVSALNRPPMNSIRLTESDLQNLTLALRSDVDFIPPSMGSGLQLTVLGPTGIALQWSAAQDNSGGSGVKLYRLYRNGSLIATLDADVLNYSDSQLTPSTTYSYEMQVEDEQGNISDKSAPISATTSAPQTQPDTLAPPVPGGVAITIKSPTRLEVRWNAVSDESGGSGLQIYRLFRNNVYLTDVSPSAVLYLDTNLAANAPFTYQVTAKDNAGNESAKSTGASATTPAVVASTLYANRCQSCHLPYATSDVRNETAANIRTAIGSVAAMSILNDLGDAELAALEAYLVLVPDTSAPTVPSGLSLAVASSTQINVSWGASTDAGGSNLAGYRIYRGTTLVGTVGPTVLTFASTGLTPSTSYSYQVEAFDGAGNVSAKTAAQSATTQAPPAAPDTTPPLAPAAPTGSVVSATRLQINWTATSDNAGGSGVAKYRVRRNGTQIAEVNSVTLGYLDADLPSNASFSYTIVAVDNANNVSSASPALNLSTPAANGVTLYANRCASCHNPLATSTKSGKTAAQITAAIEGPTAASQMSGLTDLGPDEIAAIATALAPAPDTTAPTVPASLAGTAQSTTRINLTWNVSTDSGGSGLKSYELYLGSSLLATVNAPTAAYSHTGLSAATDYAYKIRSVDNAGNRSAFSAVVTVRTPNEPPPPDTTPPVAPAAPTGSVVSATRLQINWAAASDNTGGSGIGKYRLRRNGTQIAEVMAGTRTYLDVNLPDGTSYNYSLIAVDNANNVSPASANLTLATPVANGATLYANRCASCHNPLATSTKSGKTAAQITAAISGTNKEPSMSALSVLGPDEIAAIASALAPAPDTAAPTVPGSFAGLAASTTRINLTWNTSTDTGGSGLKNYQLYLGTTLLATVNAPTTSYSHTGLTASTSYTYKVRAVDNANNASAFTATVTIRTPDEPPPPDTTAPAVPANLAGTPSTNSVALSWSAASDNAGGSGVVSYKLYRGGTFLKSVLAPAVTASDANLAYSTSYAYQVAAVDGAGNESAKSAARSVTTLPPNPAVIYAARCASCHGSYASSNLKNRYPTAALFKTAFNNAIKPVAQGGIAEMQNRVLDAAELTAIADVMAGEDEDPGGDGGDAVATAPVAGTRLYVSSLLKQVFVNDDPATAVAADTSASNLIDSVITKNPTLGGSCSRYDGNTCPSTSGTHSVFIAAQPRPSQNASRAGYILNICPQLLNFSQATTNALVAAGLTSASPANDANVRKLYALFFPRRTAEAGVISNLIAVHAQSLAQSMNAGDAWRMVIWPLCESAAGGSL